MSVHQYAYLVSHVVEAVQQRPLAFAQSAGREPEGQILIAHSLVHQPGFGGKRLLVVPMPDEPDDEQHCRHSQKQSEGQCDGSLHLLGCLLQPLPDECDEAAHGRCSLA